MADLSLSTLVIPTAMKFPFLPSGVDERRFYVGLETWLDCAIPICTDIAQLGQKKFRQSCDLTCDTRRWSTLGGV